MIVHIVVFRLKADQKEQAAALKAALDALPEQIEQIQHYEIGLNEVESPRAFDMSLISKFASYEDMQNYQQHPAHQAVLQQLLAASESIHSVDYTL